jgi:hypothetical protein
MRTGRDVVSPTRESAFGVDIEDEQRFQQELRIIVDEMKVNLADETKILEGTLNPQYGKEEWMMPDIPRPPENEHSERNCIDEQWKSDSQNGSLTTDPTLTSMSALNSLPSTAEPLSPPQPMEDSDVIYETRSTDSCSGNLADSGNETDATNECSECTVQMISVQMLGTPNEVKW